MIIKTVSPFRCRCHINFIPFIGVKYIEILPISPASMQKPDILTTFGQSDCINNIYLDIKDLTPATDGQLIPAESGQGRWLFQAYQPLPN